jgi:hypothetical protein
MGAGKKIRCVVGGLLSAYRLWLAVSRWLQRGDLPIQDSKYEFGPAKRAEPFPCGGGARGRVSTLTALNQHSRTTYYTGGR